MESIVSVIESEKGLITSVYHWKYTDMDASPISEAEDFFIRRLEKNTKENFSQEQIESILDDGFFDCDNGYSIVLHHGILKN